MAKELGLWRHAPATGKWEHVRSVTEETGPQWKAHFESAEPTHTGHTFTMLSPDHQARKYTYEVSRGAPKKLSRSGESSNLMTKSNEPMPQYSEAKGWQGGHPKRLYAITDRRTGETKVRPAHDMRGIGPEVDIRHANRNEAEKHWQSPLHPGWMVETVKEPTEKKAEGGDGWSTQTGPNGGNYHFKNTNHGRYTVREKNGAHDLIYARKEADGQVRSTAQNLGSHPNLDAAKKKVADMEGMGKAEKAPYPTPGRISTGYDDEEEQDETPVHGMKQLGAKLHEWHSGMGDPIYGVGSMWYAGHPAPMHQVQAAHGAVSRLHRQSTGKDKAELGQLKNHLARAMATAIKGGQPAQKSEQPLAVLARGVVSAMALRLLVKAEDIGKSEPLDKARKQETLGTTRSGKTVYGPTSAHVGAEQKFMGAVKSYGHHHPEIDRTMAEEAKHTDLHMKQHADFSPEDHLDAAALHAKAGGTGSRAGAGTKGDVHIGLAAVHRRMAKEGTPTAKSEPLDKSAKKSPEHIGDGVYFHRHGMDANGNHSVWVSKGSGPTKKIQTNQNLPETHRKLRGKGAKLDDGMKKEIVAHVKGEMSKSESLSKVREQRPGEEFSSYAREHAANWMRQEHPEADAQAYAEHFVNTYPEGNDESGNSIDHPTAHRIWKDSKESSKPFEVVPKSGRVAPASKPQPQRNKTFVVVPKSGITWMHGQRPKK